MTTTPEALALAEAFRNNIGITGADRVAAALASLAAQRDELKDAARINLENYEFQRNKADRATAAMYDIHYALKDAGWHPGRTDDKLADIIRARGVEMGELKAELERLRAQVAAWETQLTAIMPADFKDWHENSRAEWPRVTVEVIKALRESEEFWIDAAGRTAPAQDARNAEASAAMQARFAAELERFELLQALNAGTLPPTASPRPT